MTNSHIPYGDSTDSANISDSLLFVVSFQLTHILPSLLNVPLNLNKAEEHEDFV